MQVFARTISFSPAMIPITVLASLLVTTVACLLPLRSATSIDPALVLKGE
jgi:putative ABC transport system permease protein